VATVVSIRMAQDEVLKAPSVLDRAIGLTAFTVAVSLLRCFSLRATFTTARTFKRLVRRPGTPAEAERAQASQAWAAQFFPGRAACLEVSLAAFFAALLRGRAVDWCIGCRLGPAESHAWIEADGHAVGEPAGPGRAFHVTVRI
jgi:Transglutaminase-like superfamily